MPNQRIGRTVVCEVRFIRGFDFGRGLLGQRLAQFDSPLIKRVDIPDNPLCEDAVFVKRDQHAERIRRQFIK